MEVETRWRGAFTSREGSRLHADAFGSDVTDTSERDWRVLVETHSLGWVTARHASSQELLGFVNVIWDGASHAWIQDVMVASVARHRMIGQRLVQVATEGARTAGCEWLHVDFQDELRPFYVDRCGFTPTGAGLLRL